jgi:hypothetical protein
MMIHEADTPAQAGEKAMECMNDHPDQHILMQEMQFIPYEEDDEEASWVRFQLSKEIH